MNYINPSGTITRLNAHRAKGESTERTRRASTCQLLSTHTPTPFVTPYFTRRSIFRLSRRILLVIMEERGVRYSFPPGKRDGASVLLRRVRSIARSPLITAHSRLALRRMTRGLSISGRASINAGDLSKVREGFPRAASSPSILHLSLAISIFPRLTSRPRGGFNYVSMDPGQMRE